MQKLGKRFLSLIMVGTMILSCNMVAFAKEDAIDTCAINGVKESEVEAETDSVLADAEQFTSARLNQTIVFAVQEINKLTYEGSFSAYRDANYQSSWTPYVYINPAGADYCVYAAVYDPNGNRVCGTTFNVSPSMSAGSYKLADVSLNPFVSYTCKLIFDRKTNVGTVMMIAQ